jgi:predicted transcriptional regulator
MLSNVVDGALFKIHRKQKNVSIQILANHIGVSASILSDFDSSPAGTVTRNG